MTNVLSIIKQDLDIARREKNQKLLTLLTTLYSEASMIGKTKRNGDPTDDEVLSVVKKFKFGVEEISKIKGLSEDLSFEIGLYEKYLPTMLSSEELKTIISKIEPKTNLGQIMKYLKDNHNGLYDGKLASELAKEFI